MYERVHSYNSCGQVTGERWELNNRRFQVDDEGKLQVLSRYQSGDVWESAEKAQPNGKERFAADLCYFRDGKVVDKEGHEVALNKPLAADSFNDADLAMAWGADQGSRQGRRLIIKREPSIAEATRRYEADPGTLSLPNDYYLSPSAADRVAPYGSAENPRSPSDREVPQPAPERTMLREWTSTVDRCNRRCLSYRDTFQNVANSDGTLVTVNGAGEDPKPLDLKRHGITHLRMHEGTLYNADTGTEVKLNYKIDPAQLAGKPFLQFRGSGTDSSHYFITEGLPPGYDIEQKQLVRAECLRDGQGRFSRERVYSLTRSIVAADTVDKRYTLSADESSLAGFEPVKNGEVHPEYGTLRFVFKPEGKEQIRVYAKEGYDRHNWTFLQRDDHVKSFIDCRGCRFNTATTNWVVNDKLQVRDTALENDYNPPALEPERRKRPAQLDPPQGLDSKFPNGDPFSSTPGHHPTNGIIDTDSIRRAERAQLAALTLPSNMNRPRRTLVG